MGLSPLEEFTGKNRCCSYNDDLYLRRELSVVPPSMYVTGAPILHLIQHPAMSATFLKATRELRDNV